MPLTVEELEKGVRAAQPRLLGRALTLVENNHPLGVALLHRLGSNLGQALRIGITGPPGAGKSTLVDSLVRAFRGEGLKVGVICVDPSSPFSGGALLGDRVRMLRSAEDPEVFVRSMASRGCLGGLARTTQEAADLLDAAGKEIVILETVGVGQSELAVASACDLTVVVLVPESGGMVQAMKAGLMEVAELFVVNKADRPGAEEMKHQLVDASRHLIVEGRRPPVVLTSAISDGGIPELMSEILAYRAWLQEGDRKEKKRRVQAQARIRELVRSTLEEKFWAQEMVQRSLAEAADSYQSGQASLMEAAAAFWETVRQDLAESGLMS